MRKKPKILIEKTDKDTYISEQVLVADGVYAVFYQGKPISIRKVNSLIDDNSAKYTKTIYSAIGHAVGLAKKLNKKFNTTDFDVYMMTGSKKVEKRK